jgi:hypothetical protein
MEAGAPHHAIERPRRNLLRIPDPGDPLLIDRQVYESLLRLARGDG